ncbi:unnamed protein product [marine sediment metagenome]|uniref:Uncharacterized protein n=1 Tax=marine sediment metagenome TaxID=412755 RepID=X1RLA6_9ZZZZ
MKVAFAVIGWQFSIMLASPQKPNPALKLPTLEELDQMRKEAYRRFREAIEKQKQQFECMAHHR